MTLLVFYIWRTKMKKRVILFVSAILILTCMSGMCAFAFTDIDSQNELYNVTEDLRKLDIVLGYEDNTFRPESNVTRAEMADFCRRLLPPFKKGASGFNVKTQFHDMDSQHWAADSMGIMMDMGFIQGYGDNTIKPDNNVTLSEAAAILSRMLGYESMASTTGGYPYGYLNVMKSLGITDGFEKADPDTPLTRGMVATLLHKTLDAPMLMMSGYDLKNGATYVQDKEHTYRNLLLNYK